MNRDLDDERRLLDISRWQREALEPHRLEQLRKPQKTPIDWDEAVAVSLAIVILAPYLIFLIFNA